MDYYMRIKLAEQIIDKDDIEMLKEWLDTTDKYTKGSETIAFEQEWSNWLGSKYSVFVNSGSSANLLIFLALLYSGKLKDKKVIVPAVSWVTTVSSPMILGYEPIVCDCDKDNLGFSIEHFELLCKQHSPSVAIAVHVLGHANKLKELQDICNKYNVILIEDSCEAPGSQYDGKKLGTFGFASSFSFFYGHQMSTIEGGMISTNDRDFYNILLSLRSHGWLRDNENYFKDKYISKYNVSDFQSNYFFLYPGINVRSTDLNAYIGRNQLKKLDTYIATRNKNYHTYANILKDTYWIQTSKTEPVSSLGFALMSKDRAQIIEQLDRNQIECRPLICGSIQEHPFWFENYQKNMRPQYKPLNLPNATEVHKNGFYIPCHQSMSYKEVDLVCSVLNSKRMESRDGI
jgi:CDP-4-dehydro-6-deoxyglucose reductase, E1